MLMSPHGLCAPVGAPSDEGFSLTQHLTESDALPYQECAMTSIYSYACTFHICWPQASEEPPAPSLLSAQQPDPTRLSAAYRVLSDLASLTTPPQCTPLSASQSHGPLVDHGKPWTLDYDAPLPFIPKLSFQHTPAPSRKKRYQT